MAGDKLQISIQSLNDIYKISQTEITKILQKNHLQRSEAATNH